MVQKPKQQQIWLKETLSKQQTTFFVVIATVISCQKKYHLSILLPPGDHDMWDINQSVFICTALNHTKRRLKAVCTVKQRKKQRTNQVPRASKVGEWPGKTPLSWSGVSVYIWSVGLLMTEIPAVHQSYCYSGLLLLVFAAVKRFANE